MLGNNLDYGGDNPGLIPNGPGSQPLPIHQVTQNSRHRAQAAPHRSVFQFGMGWVLAVVTGCGVAFAGMRAIGPVPFLVLLVVSGFLALFVLAGLGLGIGCLVVLARMLVAVEQLVNWVGTMAQLLVDRVPALRFGVRLVRGALVGLELGRLKLEQWPRRRFALRACCALGAATGLAAAALFWLAIPTSELTAEPPPWSSTESSWILVSGEPFPWSFGIARTNPARFASCVILFLSCCWVLVYTLRRSPIWSEPPSAAAGKASNARAERTKC